MDLDDLLHNSHGKRTVENLQERLPHLSPEEAQSEAVRFEDRITVISDENRKKATSEPTAANPQGTIVGLPGVKELLSQINEGSKAQPGRRPGWAIVTSATGDYARKAFLSTKSSDAPEVFVSADDVTAGKPDPQPYKKGADLSKVDITKCIVVEDAPAGVLSGKRAGARVLGLKTTHDAKRLWLQGADFVVDDLSKVSARWEGDKIILTIDSEERPSLE
ncbi:DL-glycerol-3-phosphatase [Malassezia pachydermatis]